MSSSSNNKKGTSGKSKGRVPAHQNTTAWRHNPKSKKTAKILASPIAGVCRRCHQKLEWRKQYRKYKPRTVPGTCNLCRNKNVLAAYHTICDNCSRNHATAVMRLRESVVGSSATAQDADDHDQGSTSTLNVPQQICCMCVKEPSLEGMTVGSAEGDMNPTETMNDDSKPMRLRQLKTLERQSTDKAASSTGSRRSRAGVEASGFDDNDEEALDDDSSGSADDSDYGDADDSVQCDADQHEPVVDDDEGAAAIGIGGKGCDDDDDKDDPFLLAIGGRENLLVGEAYQQRLLLETLHLNNESESIERK